MFFQIVLIKENQCKIEKFTGITKKHVEYWQKVRNDNILVVLYVALHFVNTMLEHIFIFYF